MGNVASQKFAPGSPQKLSFYFKFTGSDSLQFLPEALN